MFEVIIAGFTGSFVSFFVIYFHNMYVSHKEIHAKLNEITYKIDNLSLVAKFPPISPVPSKKEVYPTADVNHSPSPWSLPREVYQPVVMPGGVFCGGTAPVDTLNKYPFCESYTSFVPHSQTPASEYKFPTIGEETRNISTPIKFPTFGEETKKTSSVGISSPIGSVSDSSDISMNNLSSSTTPGDFLGDLKEYEGFCIEKKRKNNIHN